MGRVFVRFCKEVRVDSAVHAEILALRKGLLVAGRHAGPHNISLCLNQILSLLLNRSQYSHLLRGGFITYFVSVSSFFDCVSTG